MMVRQGVAIVYTHKFDKYFMFLGVQPLPKPNRHILLKDAGTGSHARTPRLALICTALTYGSGLTHTHGNKGTRWH